MSDSIEHGRLYGPESESIQGLLAGMGGIVGRSTVRAVTILLPMRAMAMPVAVETVDTGEPARTSVTRTDPVSVSATNATSTVRPYSRAASAAAVRDGDAGDSCHGGNADQHHAHYDAHSTCRSCTLPCESIQRFPLSCGVRRSASEAEGRPAAAEPL